jgi:hypothetical protein
MSGFGRILEDLNKSHVAYVLVGGIAMIRHGVVRATRDIDAVFDPTEENVERILGLVAKWEATRPDGSPFEREEVGPDRTIHLATPHGDLGLLSERIAGIPYERLRARADVKRVDGVPAPICSLADLVALKRGPGGSATSPILPTSRRRMANCLRQILDEAAAGGLKFVARGGPEGHRVGLVGFDDRAEAAGAEGAEALLAGADEGGGEAVAAVGRVDREAVERPAPAVPAGDQRADDLALLGLDEEQRLGVAQQQAADVLGQFGRRGRGLGAPPELEHAEHVVSATGTDRWGWHRVQDRRKPTRGFEPRTPSLRMKCSTN